MNMFEKKSIDPTSGIRPMPTQTRGQHGCIVHAHQIARHEVFAQISDPTMFDATPIIPVDDHHSCAVSWTNGCRGDQGRWQFVFKISLDELSWHGSTHVALSRLN